MGINNGYYISAYCDIDPMGNILNTSVRHDQNISLWKVENNKVVLVHHCELERVSGIKHHNISFYSFNDFYEFLDEILNSYQITSQDIVKIIGMNSQTTYLESQIAYHSICHLYACAGMDSDIFYNEDILALSLDAEPDSLYQQDAKRKYYYAGAYIKQGKAIYFPIDSPGVLWTEAVEAFKMPEGTLMAIASASKSVSYSEYNFTDHIRKKDDSGNARLFVQKMCKEIMGYTQTDQGIKFNFYDERFTEYENKVSMVMKIIQDVSIRIVDRTIDDAVRKYSINPQKTYIALSGGYSLNCPTNTHIMHKYKFKGQLMIPCVNDSGQSIGIGLAYFYNHICKVNFKFPGAYLGGKYEVYDKKFDFYIESKTEGSKYFVQDIEREPLIWFNGRAESGPRALGNRSILADPRDERSKIKLNIIKKREWWRPVAPIILKSELSNWFDSSFESKYMLNNFTIKNEKRNLVPAILHLDNTSRVQTIEYENGLLFQMLKMFYEKTGVPILCNTSLNDKNEPIIETIDEAINFALRKGISIAYINGIRYKFYRHEYYNKQLPLKRRDKLFTKYIEQKKLVNKLNPYGITAKEYDIYMNSDLPKECDFRSEYEVKRLKRIIYKISKMY